MKLVEEHLMCRTIQYSFWDDLLRFLPVMLDHGGLCIDYIFIYVFVKYINIKWLGSYSVMLDHGGLCVGMLKLYSSVSAPLLFSFFVHLFVLLLAALVHPLDCVVCWFILLTVLFVSFAGYNTPQTFRCVQMSCLCRKCCGQSARSAAHGVSNQREAYK
jgi:hypothetical protein